MNPYRIILADDHVMFRQGIRNFIEKIKDIQISGEVNDGLELLEFLKISVPHLILLDIAMPKLRGLEALREVKRRYPQVKVLILTMHDNEEFVRQAVMNRVDGFILKEEPSDKLIHAIKAIKAGNKYFSTRLSATLASFVKQEDYTEALTNREKEILPCLARGMTIQDIADSLYISIHTVRRHRYNIMQKLDLKSMTDLVKYAISKGFID